MNEKLLERVINTPGVSGYEDEAQIVVKEVLQQSCDEVRLDRMGNVIGLKKAAKPPAGPARPLRVLLAAHVDEIGMMVKHIEDSGFIRFAPVGGLYPQAVVSQRVIIHGREPVNGVVAPNFSADNKDKPSQVKDLLIDAGMSKDALGKLIDVGDIITFAQELVKLNDKVYMGRNFDDRIGTYCLLEAMNQLGPTVADVYAVSTVQEEVGIRGMPVAAFAIEPDMGLAIDGSMTAGPYLSAHENLCALGKGTGIYIMDGLTIGNNKLVRFLFDLCSRYEIPFQKNIGGGTDASALQRSRAGVLATTVGAPVRYMHSTVQLCHADDIEATVALLKTFLEHAHELPDEGTL